MTRKLSRITLLILIVGLLAIVTISVAASSSNTEYGPSIPMGEGTIQSFVTLKGNGTPKSVGIELDGTALTGLPNASDPPSDGKWDIPAASNSDIAWFCCGYEHMLTLPAAAEATPFEHIVVNWNNGGHPPPAIYDVPHFDFHFYIISNDERLSISAPADSSEMCNDTDQFPPPIQLPLPLTCADAALALAPLSPAQSPPDFFSPGAVEPAMGNHMLDMTAPELQPHPDNEPFSQTWIFGTWKGEISYFEPMITLEYLQGLKGKACYDIKMPSVFAEAGFYPTRYCTSYQKGQDMFQITLDQFQWFEGE